MELQPVQNVGAVPATQELAESKSANRDSGFADVFMDVVKGANEDLLNADKALGDFASGNADNLQSVVMSAVKADLSFRFFLEMRNRMTEAYQEISRMQF